MLSSESGAVVDVDVGDDDDDATMSAQARSAAAQQLSRAINKERECMLGCECSLTKGMFKLGGGVGGFE